MANSLTLRFQRHVKRLVDIIGAAVLLVLLAPVFLIIGLAVKLDTPGPALFLQDRVGLRRQIFRIVKFRSMEVSEFQEGRNITRIGRLLRSTLLDELPQLYCVLKGDMSLVGPRPELPEIVAEYRPLWLRRFEEKPGLTGPWQVSGLRHRPIHENIKFDLYYVRHWSLWLDFRILLATVATVLDVGRIFRDWRQGRAQKTTPDSFTGSVEAE